MMNLSFQKSEATGWYKTAVTDLLSLKTPLGQGL